MMSSSAVQASRMGKSASFRVVLPVLLVLLTAAGSTGWLVHQADREMRESLLKQAQTVAQTLSIEQINALSGSRADLDSPDYLAVKQQLATVQKTLEKCRFVYLTGRQSDGTVFFFADSEPVNSRDYSPPGQVYGEAPKAFSSVFNTRTSRIEGPYSDRWGIWITALIPLSDPENSDRAVVLGMDIDARTWKWEIMAHAALPAGSTLAVLILLASWLIATHRQADTSIKPIQRRLMIPLATILLLLVGGFAVLLLKQQGDSLNQSSEKMLAGVSSNLLTLTNEQSRTLAVLGQTLLRDTPLREALKKGDRERLLADYGPVFKQFQTEQNLTHCYFIRPDRICLLRIHKPEKYGDTINRFTLLEAERTGQTASGLELGPMGTFTLRLVIPVRDGDVLIGYLELGKEIEDTLKTLHAQDGFEVAVTIHKKNLNQTDWEAGMKMLGREADWNRFAEDTVIYSSRPHFPPEIERFVGEQRHTHGNVLAKIPFNGHSWQVMATPLKDVSGAEVGDLFLLQDITDLQTMQNRLVMVGIGGILILLTSLFGFLFVLLRHTDQSIQMQQRELVAREERHRSMFERNRCVQLLIDPRDGAILDANSAACAFYGYTLEQMRQMKMSEINLLPEQEILRQMEAARAEQQYSFYFQHRLANGQVRDVEVHSSPIPCGGHDLIYCIIHDITDRKRAEQALRESEALQRLLLENIDAGVMIIDANTHRIERINAKGLQLFGGTKDGIIGHVCHQFLCPAEVNQCPVTDLRQEINSSDRVLLKSNGDQLPILKSARQIQINGKVKILETFLDITDRKRAEENLRLSLSLLDSILESTANGILVVDRKGKIIKWNHKFITMWRIPEELARQEEDEKLLASVLSQMKDPQAFLDKVRALYADLGENGCDELELADGRVFERDYHPHRLGNEIIGRVWSFHDITERKQAEEALRAEEARIRAITESAQDAILMMNPAGNISFWNPAAERIFGYSSAEVLGRNLHSLLVPERYRATHQEAFARFQATGEGHVVGKSVELEACHKDGREMSVELSLSALRLADGWHSVGILRDITARKQAEEAMREMNLALERQTLFSKEMASEAQMASAAKSEFLANMSHEIRTPMNGVIGMTGLLLDTDLTDEQRRYAQTVRSCGESLLSLINDILDFSKIEAKRLDLETLDFDLQNLLDDFAATLALRAHDKGLELICAAAPNVPSRLRGDPGRLRQILTNLAGNALKFTQQGEVAIRATLESETREDILLRFTIRDTGIGIPPDKIAQIFDKFTQADSSTTRKYGGTGLGLAISKQLSELMGGEIGVESTEGVGTEFWFTVRLCKQPEGEPDEQLTPTDLHNIRILIVDDNATSREILTCRTRSWGMRPSEAPEGSQALQLLQEARDAGDPFRIAVIDMQMPGMDGETLGKTIRADCRLAETRLVLLTSLGTRGDAHHFQEIGFSAYLTKPTRNQELYGVLSLALAERDPKRPPSIVTRHSTQNLLQLPTTASVRILLAEDNIINQQVALGILKKFGLRADAVANGVEAIKALETLPYDIVLMDVQMPVMDGLEATRQVRNPHSSVLDHTLPIIAMTAHTMQGDREQCLAAGMNDYVSKPVTPGALAEVLGKWIQREKVEGEAKTEEIESRQAPSPEAPVWDRAGMLERLMEDEELAEEILNTFLDDIPRQIQILETLLDAGDIPGVRRQAHSIKGASANIGGEHLRIVAFAMEKAASQGDLTTTENHLPELKAQFERLRDAIRANTWAS